ncbi:MAG: SGNH/GDSL hydrolase family protein [Silvibacterium sp.]|nr:SGNH/GDSL hydrolase family protein [Silvibacterium sp.]MBV8438089.1 SGNH/GDSL hydrolase family protein [Silvibacterium sp.]
MRTLSTLRATVTTAALVACSIAAHAAASSFDAIYVFGDSYCDVGNISIASGGAIPGPLYYKGRFSNGYIWIDHLAGAYGVTVTPSLAGGTDYAFGGAEVTAPVPEGAQSIPSVPDQVALYLEQHNGKADPHALYIVEGGGNDILNAPAGTSPQDLGGEIAFGLAASVELLERAGARHLLVPNLFDVGKLPAARLTGISSFATATTLVVNQQLNFWLLLESFSPRTHIYRPDAFDWLQAVFADSFHFGFNDVTDPCLPASPLPSACSNLFWDVEHPTIFGHSMLATLAVQAIHQQ